MRSRTASPTRPKSSPLRQSPVFRKENCSKGLLKAVLSHLSAQQSLHKETQFGYYPGGFYRVARRESPVRLQGVDLQGNQALETTLSSTLGSLRHWLSPKFGPTQPQFSATKPGNCPAACRSCSRPKSRLKTPKAAYPLAVPKLFSFTGPLVSFRPNVAFKKRPFQHRLRRSVPAKGLKMAESEAMTCINVRIPTPQVKLPGPWVPNDGDEAVLTHKKAISQGDSREIGTKSRKMDPVSTDFKTKSSANVQISP